MKLREGKCSSASTGRQLDSCVEKNPGGSSGHHVEHESVCPYHTKMASYIAKVLPAGEER